MFSSFRKFVNLQTHRNLSREVLNMTSRVLNDELNTNFKSYRVGIFNGQRSAWGPASIIINQTARHLDCQLYTV